MRYDLTADVYNLSAWDHHLGNNRLQLVVADPPYGFITNEQWDKVEDVYLARQLVEWCHDLEKLCFPGAALYLYGGYGKPHNRAFYRFILGLEEKTNWRMAAHLTWHKKRAFGVQNNYLSCREEIAYCVLGDVKRPRVFNIPLLQEIRGYDGYNKKYPAKSKYKRRTMVWNDVPQPDEVQRSDVWEDVTEILKGKTHPCEKPKELSEIIVSTSSNQHDWVLDAFAGSRNCANVCEQLGRNVISVEQDGS